MGSGDLNEVARLTGHKSKKETPEGGEWILTDGEERREGDGIHTEWKQEDRLFGESGERESAREGLWGIEEIKVEAEVGKKPQNVTHVWNDILCYFECQPKILIENRNKIPTKGLHCINNLASLSSSYS